MAEWHVPLHEILENWTIEQLELMFQERNKRARRTQQASGAQEQEPERQMRTWKMPDEPPPPPAYWKK